MGVRVTTKVRDVTTFPNLELQAMCATIGMGAGAEHGPPGKQYKLLTSEPPTQAQDTCNRCLIIKSPSTSKQTPTTASAHLSLGTPAPQRSD